MGTYNRLAWPDDLQNAIAISLQNTIAVLGPIPDVLGIEVKRILSGDEALDIIGLGIRLDDCVKNMSWAYLHGKALEK